MSRTLADIRLSAANEVAFAALCLRLRRLMAQVQDEGTFSVLTAVIEMPAGSASKDMIIRRQDTERLRLPLQPPD